MASLKGLLTVRNPAEMVEDNLETGYIYSWTPGTNWTNFCNGVCWTAKANGTAIIEIWGAGGSGARMCCCGDGLPGNAGAYVKKTITVETGDTLTGSTGMACQAHPLCHSGCSDPTGVCWVTANNGNGCLCARGGYGGKTMCTTGSSLYCCFRAQGFCTVRCNNDNCGMVCNWCDGAWPAEGYGGDVNCCGQLSCSSFFGCCPHCKCRFQQHVATPAGLFAENGALITFQKESDGTPMSQWSGNQLFQFYAALNLATKSPYQGNPLSYCWRSDRSCGCYPSQGYANYLPVGTGGIGPNPCPEVRDHGIRGGFGGVRIKFIPS
jgi:hypothetical protein|tara:strand:+ start:1034 stop:1999 length:966 start_codon:yes stop_codon:yes gene_type:complete